MLKRDLVNFAMYSHFKGNYVSFDKGRNHCKYHNNETLGDSH